MDITNFNEMSVLMTLLLMSGISYVGYLCFKCLHMPAAALTGSLFTIAIVTSLGIRWAKLPAEINIFIQIMIGILTGTQFSKEKVKQIRKLIIPGLLVALWLVFYGIGVGYLIAKFTELDIGTALFGAVPGGMSEMSVLAMIYNLDVPKVVLFQYLRVVIVYFSVPMIASFFHKDILKTKKEIAMTDEKVNNSSKKEYHIFFTLLIGGLAGYIAWKINIPAGAIIAPIFVIGGLRSYGLRLKSLSHKIIVFTQMGLGAFLGLTFTPSVAKSLYGMIEVSLVFTILIILNSLVLSYIMHKVFKWDIITSLLACAAAGISQMSSIALEMDADAVVVSIIQTIRLVVIILVLPPIILYIIN